MPETLKHLDESSKGDRPSKRKKLPSLDWRKLVALGVADRDAQEICEQLRIHTLSQHYCKRLVKAGLPQQDARWVALAIAQFDMKGVQPTSAQQGKLYQYALPLCRTNLWRSRMFLKNHD